MRLKCISALPEGNTKAELLLKFLDNDIDKIEDRNQQSESTEDFDHSQLPRMPIVDLIDKLDENRISI